MIATLRKFGRMTWAQRRLAAEAVVALAVARLLFAVLPFAKAASLVQSPNHEAPTAAERQIHIAAVRRAILAVARRVPWRAMCLEQGFATHWMLRRRSIPAVLHYGVKMRDGELKAHVWVRSENTDIIGCENRAEFAEIAQFPGRS